MGRRDELAALHPPEDGGTALVVLRGDAGSGRSTLLAELERDLSTGDPSAGRTTVLRIGYADEPVAWDLYGAGAVLTAVRGRFERLDAAPGLASSLDAVRRLTTPDTYRSRSRRAALLAELDRMFTRIGSSSRVVVLADDVDAVPMPVFALAPAQRAGHLVVAGCGSTPGGAAAGDAAELGRIADRVVELPTLPDADVEQLLRRTVHARIDRCVPAALRSALGPLFGNPQVLLATVADLRRRDRLVVVHDHLCLRDPAEPIGLPDGHRLLADVGAAGGPGADLVVLAAGAAEFGVDDLPAVAAATGRREEECGPVVDRLVDTGVLEADDAGRLTVRCPALATTVLARAGTAHVEGLHRAMAERLLAEPRHGRPAVLADHVAAAGRAFPGTPELATALHDAAVRVAALHPERAVRRHHAAWWHAVPGRGRSRVQSELVRLLVRTGRYDELARFVAEIVERAVPTAAPERTELAGAAALAALNLGHPVPVTVRDALADPADPHCPLRFGERWFAGEPVALDEVVSVFGAVAARWVVRTAVAPVHDRAHRRRRASSGVELAFRTRQLVPVFEWLFGAAYGAPRHGPVATFHRVVQGYTDGAWSDALCAARQLTVGPDGDPLGRQVAALLAAEMSIWRGEDRRATAWLDTLPADGPFRVLRGWVECGAAYREGDPERALALGLRAYTGVDDLGGWRLLLRMTVIATECGKDRWLSRLAASRRRLRPAGTHETVLLVDALLYGDGDLARDGYDLARRREQRPDLVWACLVAGLVADEPEPWLHEAYTIAQEIGAPRLRAKARQLMDTRGITAPVTRTRSERFTDVELRIVELIRQGRTNRQIALAIHVSEKTVENHLTRLFLKAGCRTRHGLAAASLDGRLEQVGA